MKRMASVKKKSSSRNRSVSNRHLSAASRSPRRARGGSSEHFAVCVQNNDYAASLELRKLYRVLEDDFAERHSMIRVIDESGEDYLYPQDYFVRVALPVAIEQALAKIA
jgi:hypothetical protein